MTLLVALLLDIVRAVVYLFGGVLTGSVGLLSMGIDNTGDLMSSYLTYKLVKQSQLPPDADHHYGHYRFEVAAAVLTSSLMLAVCLFIGYLLIWRYTVGLREIGVEAPLIAVSALLINLVRLKIYSFYRVESVAASVKARDVLSDILQNTVIIVGTTLGVEFSPVWDLVSGIGILAFTFNAIFNNYREILDAVTDKSPSQERLNLIMEAARSVEGVKEVRGLRARLVSNKIFLDLDLAVDPDLTVEEAHKIALESEARVKDSVREVKDVVIHLEPAD